MVVAENEFGSDELRFYTQSAEGAWNQVIKFPDNQRPEEAALWHDNGNIINIQNSFVKEQTDGILLYRTVLSIADQ